MGRATEFTMISRLESG